MSLAIAGLDLSLLHTGIAFPGGSTEVLAPTVLKGTARHAAVRAAVLERIRGADVVVKEAPFLAHMTAVTQDLVMLHGVVNMALWSNRIAVAHVAPATLKKFATGNGHATKDDMRVALHDRGVLLGVLDDNEIDAYWLRIAGLQHFGPRLFSVPDDQVDALGAAVWPTVDAIAAQAL